MGVISIKSQQAQSLNAVGASGTVWTSNGITATPSWQSVSGGSGTVTSVSVVSANGFTGTVATATTTPAITITTSINASVLKGNGTAISAATAGTDYVAPGGALGTPSSGTLTNCTFPTLNQNTSGTAANLSGTPALPNGTTATTQSANDNSTKLATTAYADAVVPAPPYISGNWYDGCVTLYSTSGSSTLAINTLRAVPCQMRKTVNIAKLGCMVNTAANAKIRLCIWNDNGSMYPSSVVYDSGQITATPAAFLSHTVSGTVTLNKGTIYWFGMIMDGVCNLPGYTNRLMANLLMGVQGLSGDTPSYIGYTQVIANAWANGSTAFTAGATLFNNINLYSLCLFTV